MVSQQPKQRIPTWYRGRAAASPSAETPIPTNRQPRSIKSLTRRYILALSTIALLALIGQAFVQTHLLRQQSDSLVVNIAGRQRMLSQRLSKSALAIQAATTPEERAYWVSELDKVTRQWAAAHLALQNGGPLTIDGSPQADEPPMVLPGSNSEAILALFEQVDPAHAAMVVSAETLLANPDSEAVRRSAVAEILNQEDDYLAGMELIVFQYDEEAAARVTDLRRIEYALLMITLLVLLVEGLWIFRPAVARIHQTVTDLRQVSSDLRISEERYRTLVESSHDLIFCLDSAGQFLYMNQTFMTTLGISAEAMPTLKLSEIVTPGFRTFCNVMLRRTMRGKAYMGLQLNFRTANDDEIMVEGDILPTSNGEDVMMAQCVFRNITLRRQAETALRDSNSRLVHLSRRLIHIQEEASRHLSRELHDEIGQRMTVVKMQLQALKYKADLADSAEGLDETIKIVEHTLQQIRSISLDLHPSLLDDMGLVATLRWYLDKQAQWGNFETHFSTNLTERLPAEVELVCFRVVQEAVTNVMRHAYANHVHVNLNETPQRVLLTIQDDGIGFDVENALEHSAMGASLGLRGMEERVSLANGRLEIESTFGEGTTVRLTVYPANTPVRPPRERTPSR